MPTEYYYYRGSIPSKIGTHSGSQIFQFHPSIFPLKWKWGIEGLPTLNVQETRMAAPSDRWSFFDSSFDVCPAVRDSWPCGPSREIRLADALDSPLALRSRLLFICAFFGPRLIPCHSCFNQFLFYTAEQICNPWRFREFKIGGELLRLCLKLLRLWFSLSLFFFFFLEIISLEYCILEYFK